MDVGILGGTGPAGKALAARLASVGYDVVVGSRSEEKASAVCDDLRARWPEHELSLEPSTNEGAAKSTLVVVATQWAAAEPTVASVADALGGKVVISMGNALAKVGKELLAVHLPQGSVAAAVQLAAPDAMVAAAFQHVPARELGQLDHPMGCDVLICTDHAEALEATSTLVRAIAGLRPLSAGSLAMAGTVEAFTAVLVRFRKASLRLTGIDAVAQA
ncbi:MAG: 8-hydroxy-5-deazaflavin:NADPH oxidoreductase [Actinomycetota bacterium]|jgi:NADPH-dependent F420 reductase|nr:8-hydroxy-5-deazaflavin:NADPH oxidoreductase [Actinomycetota bacterium]MEA2973055.1 8-hydroxy-5-deazaflavin:NADPH oxidoreductase [Actinomycetota bacterium]